VRAGPHRVAGLGRDDQLIAVAREVFAQDAAEGLLGRARHRAVIVREVEVRDPEVEGAERDGARGRGIVDAPEIMPEPERDLREMQAGFAAAGLEGRVGIAGSAGGVHAVEKNARVLISQRENRQAISRALRGPAAEFSAGCRE